MSDFERAVEFVRSGKSTGDSSNDVKLAFYKYFKQATEGDVQGSQPYAVQFEARAKWDAWNSVKGTSADDAKANYVKTLDASAPTWRTL